MKKLLIIMTLFMSSFFLFCNKEVKAKETIITYEDYSYVSSDVFNTVKQIADDTVATLDFNQYIIFRHINSSDSSKNTYYVYYFNANSLYINYNRKTSSASDYDYRITGVNGYAYHKYEDSTGAFTTLYTTPSNTIYSTFISNYGHTYISSYYLVYSTVPITFKDHFGVDLVINYPDITYTFKSSNIGDTFPTLYDVYMEYGGGPSEPEEPEELKVVTNFYTSVIEKLSYLAETFASNYVFLSIIVIFIITFIFLLIFRRFL